MTDTVSEKTVAENVALQPDSQPVCGGPPPCDGDSSGRSSDTCTGSLIRPAATSGVPTCWTDGALSATQPRWKCWSRGTRRWSGTHEVGDQHHRQDQASVLRCRSRRCQTGGGLHVHGWLMEGSGG